MIKNPQVLLIAGFALIFSAALLIFYIFAPVAKVEINYELSKVYKPRDIVPADTEFGLIIPKIGANAKIIPNVDPYDSRIYEVALAKGVAQAKGSVYPNQAGNTFLFSHSSANFIEATRYNSIFYLLGKLKKGDIIYVYYKKLRYEYHVSEIKVVDPSDISYLNPNSKEKTLTLMTCWPAGTNLKRLLVIAK